MSIVDSLLLDAKQAILEEQHRRFQVLHREGRWQEAMQQFQATMVSAADLLTESLRLLENTIERQKRPSQTSDPPPATE